MVAVNGSQFAGDQWPTVGSAEGPTPTSGATASESSPAIAVPAPAGERMQWSSGAASAGRRSPIGPVVLFVDPKDAHGGGTAQRLAEALKQRPGESGESHLSRTMQTLRDILQAGDLSDGDKGNLLAQAVDTMMGAGMTLKAEAQALIAKAKSERDRLDALLATVKA